jgi:hypothetical protein
MVIRVAVMSDIPMLRQLIAASARGLACADYTPEQVEAALGTAWGVDTQLIQDGTYFVVTVGDQPRGLRRVESKGNSVWR